MKEGVMKKIVTCLTIVLSLSCAIFFACSKDKDIEPEKGRIEKMTDRTADAIVKKIKTPIERARAVKDMEKERMEHIDETLKQ
jgi:hypothetical protein